MSQRTSSLEDDFNDTTLIEDKDEIYDKRWKNVRVQQAISAQFFSRVKNYILVVGIIWFLYMWTRAPTAEHGPRKPLRALTKVYPGDYVNHEYGMGNIAPLTGFSSWFGKDQKIVIVLATNEAGGVLKWKNEQEWAIEKISIKNKLDYARKHGYGLILKDLTTAKKYSHEYREGWQKADILREVMDEFPKAEWYWWLDLDTLIMEPRKSLEDHILKKINAKTYRSLDVFNPLRLEEDIPYVDYTQSMDLLITQDCGGFNLGSFLIRNSDWSTAMLDIWWDPICYEQKHMVWEHKEQDALETLYAKEAWIRSRVGFLPLRMINSFPPGACNDYSDDPQYFYDSNARDFVVNMAGCNYGRDCWGEMQYYYNLREKLNKNLLRRLFFFL
ncbi:putative alpha-1,6-mannosyltransferase MNN10 [Nakaseomyces bracarensis]|uniref:Alpha-1,6-mannosyltransferase MNN10 n=1 Tax=Nakaseomyces bracarensis TaxID=273131 RepID=A0ABR4NUG0_9SACH